MNKNNSLVTASEAPNEDDLSVYKYNDEGDKMACKLCCGQYQQNDVIWILGCSHHYHKECMDNFRHSKCGCYKCEYMIEPKSFEAASKMCVENLSFYNSNNFMIWWVQYEQCDAHDLEHQFTPTLVVQKMVVFPKD